MCATSQAQPFRRAVPVSSLPMDRVYQGQVRLPDFRGKDRKYANFRTRISEGMSTGPDFAGHYAIVQIGCGTGCSSVYVGDVATGEIFGFPYGGEDYNGMQLNYSAKSDGITIYWTMNGRCFRDSMRWNGATFEQALGSYGYWSGRRLLPPVSYGAMLFSLRCQAEARTGSHRPVIGSVALSPIPATCQFSP